MCTGLRRGGMNCIEIKDNNYQNGHLSNPIHVLISYRDKETLIEQQKEIQERPVVYIQEKEIDDR